MVSLRNSIPMLKQLYVFKYPSIIVSLAMLMLFILTIFAPKFAIKKKLVDLRPYLIVYNGLSFGVSGCGFSILMFGINYARDSWTCGLRSTNLVEIWVGLHLTQIYVILRLMQNVIPIVKVMKGGSLNKALIEFTCNTLFTAVIWGSVSTSPLLPYFFMIPLCDVLRLTFNYAYFILVTAQGKRQEFIRLKYFIHILWAILLAANYAHMIYFLNIGCDFPKSWCAAALTLLTSEWLYKTGQTFNAKVKNY